MARESGKKQRVTRVYIPADGSEETSKVQTGVEYSALKFRFIGNVPDLIVHFNELPEEIKHSLMAYGASQKIGDSGAINNYEAGYGDLPVEQKAAVARERMFECIEFLKKGEFSARLREPYVPDFETALEVLKRSPKLYGDVTREKLEALLEERPDLLKFLYKQESAFREACDELTGRASPKVPESGIIKAFMNSKK